MILVHFSVDIRVMLRSCLALPEIFLLLQLFVVVFLFLTVFLAIVHCLPIFVLCCGSQLWLVIVLLFFKYFHINCYSKPSSAWVSLFAQFSVFFNLCFVVKVSCPWFVCCSSSNIFTLTSVVGLPQFKNYLCSHCSVLPTFVLYCISLLCLVRVLVFLNFSF